MKILAVVLSTGAICAGTPDAAWPQGAGRVTDTVEVTLPSGAQTFAPGKGSDLANSQCVICHSTDMVTRQPPMSFSDWKAEVSKMRAVYGAPLSEDQIEPIARYLTRINGKP